MRLPVGRTTPLLCVLAVLGCEQATGPSAAPATITLASPAKIVYEGAALSLSAVATDGGAITYASRDPEIARVSPDGVVSGILTGSTYVIAASGTARDSVLLTVLVRRDGFDGRPYGAAISRDGLAFVTVIGLEEVARAPVPFPEFTTAARVGAVPTDVQFNSTGTRAYVSNQFDESIAEIDVATGAWIDTIAVEGDAFRVLVAPGDSMLWVTTNANSVFVIRLATKEIVARIPTVQDVNGLAARGDRVWISTLWAGTVLEVNAHSYAVERVFDVGGIPQELIVSPDGERLYIANEAGKVQIWSLDNGTELASIALPGGGGFGMARHPGNGFLYVSTGYYSRTVWVVNPESEAIVRRIQTGGTPRRIAFDPGAQIGIVTNEYGWIDLIH
ncbi:MAG: hypothetical protein ACREMN_00285 [Gemmatimonadales bacterium]